MRKLLLFFCALFLAWSASAQLSGIKSIPGDYVSVAAAITDLNTQGVGPGGVTFNVAAGHAETFASPSAGLITATGTSDKPIVFQKSGTTPNPQLTAGVGTAALDGIIVIAGGDYITFDGIDVIENSLNTTSNQRMEWGYALVKGSATAPFNGCQNVVIKNCTITLNKANTSSTGIYTGNHIATASTSLTITAASDAMNNCKFFSNVISNVYSGIRLNGYSTSTLYDQGNEVGKDGGNIISNYGGSSSTAYGVYAIYQNGIKVANNTITSGTGTTTTLYGIYLSTGTNSNVDIYNNIVTISGGATTSTIYAIRNEMGSSGTNNTVNIYNNFVQNCSFSTATTGVFNGILNSGTSFITNIYNNTVSNNTLPGTGDFFGIYNSAVNGTNVVNIYNNTVRDNQKTGTGGSMYSIRGNTATNVVYGNSIFNIALGGGTGTNYGIYNGASPVTESYYNNTIHDLSQGGTGPIYGLQISTAHGTKNTYGNTIYNLVATGGSVYGIGSGYGNPHNIFKNQIYNLSAGGTTGVSYGINITGGTLMNVYNNFISNIKSPASTSTNAVFGLNIGGGTTVNAYYNTIFLNATSTSTTTFGSTGIYKSSSTMADLRNNLVMNNSTPGPTGGLTVALRFSGAYTGTNYAALSNNNNFYAGTPAANRLVFYDGTLSAQTIDAFQTLVSPMDNLSFSENTPLVNTTTAPYDLHVVTTTPTLCMSGGTAVTTPVNITDDIDGQARNSIPCVGADEFAGIMGGLANPTGVAATVVSSRQINIAFTPNASANNVVLVFNTTGTFTAPSGTPVVGDPLAGGTVLSFGITSPFNHTGLTGGTKYYYKLFSYDGTVYSLGVPLNATTGVAAPATFTAAGYSSTEINLAWTLNAQGNQVVVAYNPTANTFGSPVNGTALNVGDPLTGGGSIIYVGPLTSYIHTGLTTGTKYYKIWSVDAFTWYSGTGLTASASPSVAAPTAFTATAFSGSQINLAWTQNLAGHDVMVAVNSTSTFGTPANGTNYTVGTALPTAGTVIFNGPGNAFNHTGLTAGTLYYYKAWSKDGAVVYSSTGATTSSTTLFEVPYTQNFNASTSLPTGWGGTMLVTASHGTSSSNGLNYNLYSTAPSCNATAPNVLITANPCELKFDYRIVDWSGYPTTATALGPNDKIEVQASIDGGTNYSTIHTINSLNHTTSLSFVTKTLPLTGFSAGGVKIKFLGTWGSGDYYVDIDNFVLQEVPNCLPPTAFTAAPFNSQQINLTFTPNANNNNVVIVYNSTGTFSAPSGAPPAVGGSLAGGTVLSNGTAVPVVHSGLTYNVTVYYAAFSYDGSIYSPAALSNAKPQVSPPTSFTATAVSMKMIDLTWVKNSSNHDVMIATNDTNTFTNPVNGIVYPVDTVLGGSGKVIYKGPLSAFSHSGLTSATTYYYKAWSADEFNYYSITAPTANATTLCDVYALPYMQNFDGTTFPPVCWTRAQGLLQPTVTFTSTTTSAWYQTGWDGGYSSADKAANINIWSTGKFEWLISPQFDLGTDTTPSLLEFDLRLNAYASANPPGTSGTDDKFAIVISTDGGATWSSANTLRLYDNAGSPYVYNNISPSGEHVVIELRGYTGVVKFGFYGETTVSNADNDVRINNLIIQPPPTCPIPTQVAVGNITNSTAEVSWRNAAVVEIDYGPVGHAAGTGTIVSGVSLSPYQITGLTGSTTYHLYLRRDCSAGDYSFWVGPIAFTTDCDPAALPYLETFDGSPFPPSCWKRAVGQLADPVALSGTSSAWIQDDWRNVTGTDKAARINIWSTGLYGWLITPIFNLGTGTNAYQLEFDLSLNAYGTSGTPGLTGVDDKFAVVISTDGGATWTSANTLRLYDNTGSPYVYNNISPSGQHVVIPLTGFLGNVKFGFYGESTISNADNDLMINNLTVVEGPPCAIPGNLQAINITAHTADLTWGLAPAGTSYNVEIGLAGFTPTGIPTDPGVNPPYTKTGLASGTYYTYYVQANCGGGTTSSWSGPKTFMTVITCPKPINLGASNITTTTADLTWTESGTAMLWNVEIVLAGSTPTGVPTYSGITSTPFNVTGLQPSSTYNFYVQSNCGGGDLSQWAGPYTFNTLCGAVTSISEGFNGTAFPPVCWSLYNGGSGPNWARSTSNVYEGTGVMYYAYSVTYPADAWAFTPEMTLTAGNIYVISFNQKVYSSYYPEKLKVTVGNAPTVAAQSTILWDNDGGASLSNTTYIQRTIEYTAPSTGSYYFAFNCYSDADMWNLYVDKVRINVKPPVEVALTSFTQTSGLMAPVTSSQSPYEVMMNKSTLTAGRSFETMLDEEAVSVPQGDVSNSTFAGQGNSTLSNSDYPVNPVGLAATVANLGTVVTPYTFTWSVGGTAQPVYNGPVIPVGSSDNVILSYTPNGLGTLITTGTATATGDDEPSNNTKSFRMRVYPDVFTRSGYDNGTNVVDTYVGWNSTTIPMKAGVRFTADNSCQLAGVDYIFRTETVTAGTVFVQVRGAGATTNAPGDVLYSKSFNTADYLPSGDAGDYIFLPFGTDAPIIQAGSDYWITIKAPVGVLFPGAAQSTNIITGRSFYQQNTDTTLWSALVLSSVEYAWIMRAVTVTPPECMQPTALTATSITASGALLDWTENGTATSWDIEFGPSGFTQGTGTMINNVTVKPYALAGLTGNTAYQFYVRANCGYGTSGWSAPYGFTTSCGVISTLPFVENFDAVTIPALPACWNKYSSAALTPWISTDNATSTVLPLSAPNFMYVTYNENLPKDEWLVTQAFSLTGGTGYYLRFWVKAPGFSGTPEKLKFVASTDATLPGLQAGTILWNRNDLTLGDYTEFLVSFTPAASGDYYFAWHAYSDANVDYIAIDNFGVELAPPCAPPQNVTSSLVTSSTATISWSIPAIPPANGYEYEVRTSGEPGSGPVGLQTGGTTASLSAALTGLSPLTTYYVYLRSDCGDNVYSEWTTVYSFETLAGVPENRTVQNDVVGNGQTNCYDATNTITVAGSGTTFLVESGGEANFIAGVSILYLPGTQVASGGKMTGKIAPNGPWCSAPSLPSTIMANGEGEKPMVSSEGKFSLFPNPTNGNFTLAYHGTAPVNHISAEIYTLSGEKVVVTEFAGQKNEFRFAHMPAGLYFVKLVSGEKVEIIKLVKSR